MISSFQLVSDIWGEDSFDRSLMGMKRTLRQDSKPMCFGLNSAFRGCDFLCASVPTFFAISPVSIASRCEDI